MLLEGSFGGRTGSFSFSSPAPPFSVWKTPNGDDPDPWFLFPGAPVSCFRGTAQDQVDPARSVLGPVPAAASTDNGVSSEAFLDSVARAASVRLSLVFGLWPLCFVIASSAQSASRSEEPIPEHYVFVQLSISSGPKTGTENFRNTLHARFRRRRRPRNPV